MGTVLKVQDGNFEKEVLNSEVPVLLDFSAEWCGPCKELVPIIEEIASEYEGKIKVGTVDVGLAQDTAVKFGVLSVPTVLFFKDGKVRDQVVGLVQKNALISRLQRLL
ncbi:MAG TPA: thioredoxin [Candidatus Polarisedimenticolia bacterium]|nr:thioredoxin [Candidatus Polarisedimenticolia bacterium]